MRPQTGHSQSYQRSKVLESGRVIYRKDLLSTQIPTFFLSGPDTRRG